MRQRTSVPLKKDMRREGWNLETDVTDITKEPVELIPLLKGREALLPGRDVGKRAEKVGGLFGQHYAEHMLGQEKHLPLEWREYLILFPGTVWRDKRARQRIPCLFWQGKNWALKFVRLDETFYPSARLIRPRSSTDV